MKKTIVFAMLMAMTFFWLPADNAASAQSRRHADRKPIRVSQINDVQHGKRKGNWHKKKAYGYRNYGQYRRTQVGNRRYRLVKRNYWHDGIRRTRLVRVYY